MLAGVVDISNSWISIAPFIFNYVTFCVEHNCNSKDGKEKLHVKKSKCYNCYVIKHIKFKK